MRAFDALLIDDLLRIVETAAALRLAVEARVGIARASRSAARDLAHFVFRNGVTDTNDHAFRYNAIATYSQLKSTRQIDYESAVAVAPLGWSNVFAVIQAIGRPTRTMWANNWVAIEIGLGGRGESKRSGTTIQFITT